MVVLGIGIGVVAAVVWCVTLYRAATDRWLAPKGNGRVVVAIALVPPVAAAYWAWRWTIRRRRREKLRRYRHRLRTGPSGPPSDRFGGVVPVRLELAVTEEAAVFLDLFVAFEAGVAFRVAVRLHRLPSPEDRWFFEMSDWEQRWSDDPGPRFLRLEVIDSEGRRAANFGDPIWAGLRLIPQGGGGGGDAYDLEYWLHPMPPRGPITFRCRWPVMGLEGEEALDGALLHGGVARSSAIWEEA